MQIKLKQLGYTLVGMSISLGVAGLILASVASGLKIYFHEKRLDTTRGNVAIVKEAIEDFVKINGYYPCPASLTVPDDNTDYGLPGNCTVSSLIDSNDDDIDDDDGFILENNKAVVRGAVPFRILNIARDVSIDSYGARIEYAVTTSLTSKANFSNAGGLIEVVGEEDDNTILPTSGKAHFVVFSHGGDKAGGYIDSSGSKTFPCSDSTKDNENCNIDDSDTATYRLMALSDLGINNNNHYDDYLLAAMFPDLPLWIEGINSTDNIFYDTSLSNNLVIGYDNIDKLDLKGNSYFNISSIAVDANGIVTVTTSTEHNFMNGDIVRISGVVGMTDVNNNYYLVENASATAFDLHDMNDVAIDGGDYSSYSSAGSVYKEKSKAYVNVNGEVKSSGIIYTHYICDKNRKGVNSDIDGNNCIKIDDIATGASCVSGYVSSIDYYANGLGVDIKLNCGDVATSDIRCPAGKVMTGITMAGGIECGYPSISACASKSVKLCVIPGINVGDADYYNDSIPTGIGDDNATLHLPSSLNESTYQEQYECTNGTWDLVSSFGECDVDSGVADVQNICTEDTKISEYNAYAIYNGAPKTAYTGLWDVEKSNICEDDFVSVEDSSISSCISGEIKVAYDDCSVGYEGYIYREYEWNCGSSSWDYIAGSEVSHCTAITASDVTYCPTGFLDENGDGDCEACSDITQSRQRVSNTCGGLATETRTYSCTDKRWSKWTQSSCVASTKTWQVSDTYPAAYLTPMKEKGSDYRLGDVCYESGYRRACYAIAGEGTSDGRPMYYQYENCVCN